MNMIYGIFVSVEQFSKNWNNTITLCGSIASILIAWLIFCKEQRISEDKSRQVFLSVLDEAGAQLSVMKQFSESLCRVLRELEPLKLQEVFKGKGEDSIPKFLSAVYITKKNGSSARLRPSLHKFHLYEELFDEYGAKKIVLLQKSKKVGVDAIFQYLKDFEGKMNQCYRLQKEISRLFPNFSVFFKDETSNIVALINLMDKHSTQEMFNAEIFQQGYVVKPNWEEAEKIYESMKKYATTCAALYGEAENIRQHFCETYRLNRSRLSAQISTMRG